MYGRVLVTFIKKNIKYNNCICQISVEYIACNENFKTFELIESKNGYFYYYYSNLKSRHKFDYLECTEFNFWKIFEFINLSIKLLEKLIFDISQTISLWFKYLYTDK